MDEETKRRLKEALDTIAAICNAHECGDCPFSADTGWGRYVCYFNSVDPNYWTSAPLG